MSHAASVAVAAIGIAAITKTCCIRGWIWSILKIEPADSWNPASDTSNITAARKMDSAYSRCAGSAYTMVRPHSGQSPVFGSPVTSYPQVAHFNLGGLDRAIWIVGEILK